MEDNSYEVATLGGGCFWCTEAVFQRVKGVAEVVSGYAGGHENHPTYESVSSKKTGHAEVVQITFDPSIVTYEQLLTIFFHTHDPTTRDRQGNDVGPQYRSIILYHSEKQKDTALRIRDQIADEGIYDHPIVTEIEPFDTFWEAETYHQNYYQDNANQPYCQAVVNPKLAKFRKEFATLLEDHGNEA